jgi:hypothetical protein
MTPVSNAPQRSFVTVAIQNRCHGSTQHHDQLRVHEPVLVGNVEDVNGPRGEDISVHLDQTLVVLILHDQDEIGPRGEDISVHLDQTLVVLILHDQDEIGPGHVGVGEPPARRPGKATGPDLDIGQPREHVFGGGTAPSVAAAHEQDVKRLGDGAGYRPRACSASLRVPRASGVPSPLQGTFLGVELLMAPEGA